MLEVMRIVATTVIRHVPPGTCSGRMLILELADDQVSVVSDTRLPENRFREVDPNRRGGTRGLRCVTVDGDQLLVTDSTGISILSARSGEVVGRVEHPLMGGVHCVITVPGGLAVTATHSDTVLAIDRTGTELWRWRPTDSPSLQRLLTMPHPVDPTVLGDFRDPSVLADHVHDVTHLNSLVRDGDDLLVSLGSALTHDRRGALPTSDPGRVRFREDAWHPVPGQWRSAHVIVRLTLAGGTAPGGESVDLTSTLKPQVLWVGPARHFPNHDLLPVATGLWFNESNTSEVCLVETGLVTRRILVPGQFLRGMTRGHEGHVIVGTQQPLTLHDVDLDQARVVRSWRIPGDAAESFTWLAAYPPEAD